MKLSITRGQRSMLLFLSAASYLAWLAGVGAPIDAQDLPRARVVSMTLVPPPSIPNVSDAIGRDPFAGSADLEAQGPDATRPDPQTSDDRDVVVPDIADVPVLDAAAAAEKPNETPRTLVVRATIVGGTSVAYVADRNASDIVRVGDLLGDRRVSKIDLEGIAFADGTRLDLATNDVPASEPVRPRASDIRIPLERLRELFARRSTTASPATATPARTPAPTVTPVAAATPAPLRTVDAAGIAPGTNPTPDLRDPTAFPYPYPYPAPHR